MKSQHLTNANGDKPEQKRPIWILDYLPDKRETNSMDHSAGFTLHAKDISHFKSSSFSNSLLDHYHKLEHNLKEGSIKTLELN